MKQTIEVLNALHAHARDMVRAYTAALDRIRDPELREVLLTFRLDHERHLSDVTSLVLRLGGQPIGRRNVRGPLLEGMAAFSALFGDGKALRALERCEEVGQRMYADARRFLGDAGEPLIGRGLHDHARHLGWLRAAAREREELGEVRPQ